MAQNYTCCNQKDFKGQDYLLGICCLPCVYGYGGYKSLKNISGGYGACVGSIVCLGASFGATLCAPLMGCYVRVEKLDQPFSKAACLECCAPFTCAPCQMAYYARVTQGQLSVDAAELL